MTPAPTQIDSADVIAYVELDQEIHKDSGSLRLYADGILQNCFFGLAIATYDLSGVYLFFCDMDWETENDTFHGSVAEAMETVERKFGMAHSEWHFYIDDLRPV